MPALSSNVNVPQVSCYQRVMFQSAIRLKETTETWKTSQKHTEECLLTLFIPRVLWVCRHTPTHSSYYRTSNTAEPFRFLLSWQVRVGYWEILHVATTDSDRSFTEISTSGCLSLSRLCNIQWIKTVYSFMWQQKRFSVALHVFNEHRHGFMCKLPVRLEIVLTLKHIHAAGNLHT